jgi:hypothetical protein
MLTCPDSRIYADVMRDRTYVAQITEAVAGTIA